MTCGNFSYGWAVASDVIYPYEFAVFIFTPGGPVFNEVEGSIRAEIQIDGAGTIGAEEGSLAIMVGGEQSVFDEVNDVFKTMGNPTLVGPVGSGQVSKLANQIIVGLTIGAVAEAVTLCEKAGADPNKMIKALSGGWADSKILQTHGKRMIDKDFTPKGKTSVHLKDMNNILECANSFNTHLPISNLVKEMYKTLVENGHGETDHSSLYKEIERINKK